MQRIGAGFLVAGALWAGRLAAQQANATRIMEEMRSGDLWTMLLVAALAGAFGGFIYELLMLRGRVELPHRAVVPLPGEDLGDGAAHKLLDLGLLARVLIGAAAAVASLWLIEPESAIALIAGSLVAGTAGIAIFRSLQDRLLAVLSAQQMAEARAQALETAGKALEIDQDFQQLREKLSSDARIAGRAVPGGEISFSPGAAPAPADLPELESISRKLGEMRGIASRMAVSAGGPVRPRVLRVLVDWSGIGEPLPDDRKVIDIWSRAGNGTVTDGNLGNLVVQLNREFPRAGLRLAPGDFRRESGVDTVGRLVDHIEHREP